MGRPLTVEHRRPMSESRIVLARSARVATVDRRLFGGFVEHLGRCVYDGIYEPGHPTANEDGFRLDVVDLVRELGTTTIRYPGGNFVSGFRWEDSVGPRDQRPVRRDARRDGAVRRTADGEIGVTKDVAGPAAKPAPGTGDGVCAIAAAGIAGRGAADVQVEQRAGRAPGAEIGDGDVIERAGGERGAAG